MSELGELAERGAAAVGPMNGELVGRSVQALERERFLLAVRESLADQRQVVAEERETRADTRAMDVSGRWQLGSEVARHFALLAAELYAEDTLEAVLQRITERAATLIPACDVASITFAHRGRYWTPSAGGPVAEQFDHIQYRSGEGPCMEATELPLVAMTGDWRRWPRLARTVPDAPVRSVLSCRVETGDGRRQPARAALNLYSFRPDGFDQSGRDVAVILAAHASVAVAAAKERDVLAHAEEDFRQALASRQVIGQATGMLMERQQLSPADAFDILRRASQRMNVKLRDLAADLTADRAVVGRVQQPDFETLGRVLDEMLDCAHNVAPDQVPMLGAQAAERVGVRSTTVFLTDFSQRLLIPFAAPAAVEPFEIEGTMGGRAFILGQPVELPHDRRVTLWVPLIDGVERIGVAQFELDRTGESRRGLLSKVAALLATEVVARGQYTDAVTLVRRTQPMTLATEMQRQLMPPPAFACGGTHIAAAVEPSDLVAGDAYDYAYNGTTLHVAVVDAIGHDLHASLVSGLAVGAYRHARRRRLDLRQTAAEMDAALSEQFEEPTFATAVLAELDTTTGELQYLNAGHPAPLLLRQGQIVGPLPTPPRLPIGLGHVNPALSGIGRARLEPRDRILFYTDGMIEARSAAGEDFGLDRLQAFIRRHLTGGRTDSELVRRLVHAVMDHHQGHLNDDATVLLLSWEPSRDG